MGKSLLLLVMLCAACANTVDQNRKSGPDFKPKGAQEIVLEEGTGAQKGIVTYPGGDRVDWKKIVLPEKSRGQLDLEMTYTTPRPDLKVSFDVFDQWYTPLKGTTGKGRTKTMTIARAKGTYFVRIFAKGRGDAGAYVMKASFAPEITVDNDMSKVPIPDPPKLARVPDPDPTECLQYDATNPICKTVCAPGSPPTHKPCVVATPPTPPPVPPTPPVVEEKLTKPVVGRIMKPEVQADGSIVVIIAVGTEHGVGRDWKGGSLLRGETKDIKAKYGGGTLTIIRVDKRTTVAKLRLGVTSDVLKENSNVVLEP